MFAHLAAAILAALLTVEAQPDAAEHNRLGATFNREGRYHEALVHAEAAVAAAPDNYRYRLNRGIVLVEHGRFAEAIADFDFALGRDAKLPYAYLEKGSALLSLDRDDEAAKQWPLARQADPSIVWPHWYEAIDDFVHRRFAAAAAGFDRVAAAEPAFGPALVWQTLARRRAALPPPAVRTVDGWPADVHKFQRGELTLDQLLVSARTDRITGDPRRVGEALFVAAERELAAGRVKEARALYGRAAAVPAPRHAWKIAAERELTNGFRG